jgi:hydrogenase expression/formation protein HypC
MCLGIPGRIVEIHRDRGLPMGVVDFGGVRREACLAYVADEVTVGDYAIVHVGFAISKVDEAEAHRTFEALREMSRLDELEWMADAAPPVVPSAPSVNPSAPSVIPSAPSVIPSAARDPHV